VNDAPARRLVVQGCYNVRDVGGYATEDGAQIRWRTLLRADNLCRLTPDGAVALLEYDIRTVVDLRTPGEAEEAPHPFGPEGAHAALVSYWRWPLRDPADDALEQAFRATTTLLETYRLNLDTCGPRLAALARAFADAPEGAFLVHCNVGKDRTGLTVALLLALAGVPTETIVADYALSAGYLQPLYDARRAAGIDEVQAAWRSEPETMHALLGHLERAHGGAERYFLAAGLTPEEIERVRARLRS
jgi:protein-tyrosine phosphatase